jgi:hypothetical protein
MGADRADGGDRGVKPPCSVSLAGWSLGPRERAGTAGRIVRASDCRLYAQAPAKPDASLRRVFTKSECVHKVREELDRIIR